MTESISREMSGGQDGPYASYTKGLELVKAERELSPKDGTTPLVDCWNDPVPELGLALDRLP